MRTLALLLGAAVCACATAANASTVDLTSLTPNYFDGTSYTTGYAPGITESASANSLVITEGPHAANTASQHNTIYIPLTGDFSTEVTASVAGGGSGGFYVDLNNALGTFAGIGFDSSNLYTSYGYTGVVGDSPFASYSGSILTLQLTRINDIFTASYSVDGSAFAQLYSLKGVMTAGDGQIDLTGYSAPNLEGSSTTSYHDLIVPGGVDAVPEPATWAMMIGGIGFAGGMMRRRYRKSEEAFTAKVRSIAYF
jgi:hypothetical protein